MKPLLLTLACSVACLAAGDNSLLTMDEYLGDWKISRQFTIAVASKMPEEFYGFKPSPEQMSFGGQMVHIAGSLAFRFAQLTDTKPPFTLTRDTKITKAVAIELLGQAFDYVIALVPKVTPEQMTKIYKVDWAGRPEVNGRQMMMNMFVHAAHHRAAAEVYLRLKGIEPPPYTF